MRKVLFIVPHQDDEINLGGATIVYLLNLGYDVHILYTTNGDYIFPAETRVKEAVEALRILGVKKQNIHLLGYGDSLNNVGNKHLYYNKNTIVASNAGKSETYGAAGIDDFANTLKSKHSKYTFENFLVDMQSFIIWISADIIFCVDCDWHADHRMTSLAFDTVMGRILHTDSVYRPTVYKTFAYSLAFNSRMDFWSDINLDETKFPDDKSYKVQNLFLLGKSIYEWNNRIRFPISQYSRCLFKNIVVKALRMHKSQHAELHAPRLINSDIIYWERRTDNLLNESQITSSSGDVKFLNDFKLVNCNDITTDVFSPHDYLWQPADDDYSPWIKIFWKQEVIIKILNIWGNIQGEPINNIKIVTNNNEVINTGKLKRDGLVNKFAFKNTNIKWIKLYFDHLAKKTDDMGIAEIEAFSSINASELEIVKIMCADNFIYNHIVDNKIDEIHLDVYKYNVNDSIKLRTVGGKSYIEKNVLHINPKDKKITVQAISSDERIIYDSVCINRINEIEKRIYKMARFFDFLFFRCRVKVYLYKLKFYNKLNRTLSVL